MPQVPRAQVLEEIIVTAERREANIQDIALAISAYSQDTLDRMGANSSARIDLLTPGMEFGQFGLGARITVRGMGASAFESHNENPVAFFVDGAYMGRTQQGFMSFYDVERIEVLRGPQGTLSGRNTTGGSLNVISKAPTDKFEAFGDVMVGNYDRVLTRATVNVPLSDTFQIRANLMYEKHDGFIKNSNPTGTDLLDQDQVFVKAALRWQPTEDLDIIVRASYLDQGGIGSSFSGHKMRSVGINPIPGFWEFFVCQSQVGFPPGTCAPGLTPPGAPVNSTDGTEINHDQPGFRDNSQKTLNATITWDFEKFQIKSITSYTNFKQETEGESDFSDFPVWQLGETEDVDDIQQEIHIASQQTEPWSWLVGFFYLDEEIKEHLIGELISVRSFLPSLLPTFAPLFGQPVAGRFFTSNRTETSTVESLAVFGSLSYFLTDQIRISVGGRYTSDDKTYSMTSLVHPIRGNVDFAKNFSEFTWKTGIDWFITDAQMLYFTASTGFLSGGFNQFLPPPGILDQNTEFAPETMLNFELGAKTRFFDDRLQVNAAIFYNDITDLQTYSFDFTIPVAVVDNSGSAKTFGVELELKAVPTDRLSLTGSLAYLDAYYEEYIGFSDGNPAIFLDVSGNDRANAPNWTASFTAAYDIPLGEYGMLTPYLQFAYKGDYFVTALNDPFLDHQDSFTQTDFRLQWESAGGHWNAEAFVQNIEDAFPIVGAFFAFNGVWVTYGPEPRTYGLRIGYRY
ncbi:MAG: TonB-dependent receptor [Bacteroidetes bacterium]|nr:TonB-dependent receptor [Bacteroidota bacterium]